MDWKLLETGKFYLAGSLTFSEVEQRFKRLIESAAMFNLKSLLHVDEDADTVYDLLMFSLETVLPLLPDNEQKFLLDKFQDAVKCLKELSDSEPTNGYVIISPHMTYADYHADNLFVYVVSNFDDDEYYFANKVIEKKNVEFLHGDRNLRYADTAGCTCIYYVFNGVFPK
jgi:hypothetical protein